MIRCRKDNYLFEYDNRMNMAKKTATVLARVDPELKEEAEEILDLLGIPTSLMINIL